MEVDTVDLNDKFLLQIDIQNPNTFPLVGVAFTDSFPVNVRGYGNSAVPAIQGVRNGCETLRGASNYKIMTDGTVPMMQSCTYRVPVLATSSGFSENVVTVSTGNAGDGVSNAAPLTVNTGPPVVTKYYICGTGGTGAPSTLCLQPFGATMIIQIRNSNAITLTGKVFPLSAYLNA